MEVVTKMAVVGQQGVGQGNPAGSGRHQREATGFLEPGSAQGLAQSALQALGRRRTARFQGVGQMGCELVVPHQTRHLLDQIHLAAQIQGPLRRHRHGPAPFLGAEGAAQGLQGALDTAIVEVLWLTINQHRTQQVVEGIAAQQHLLRSTGGAPMQPAALQGCACQLLEQRHGSITGGEGAIGRQPLLEAAARLGAQSHAAGRTPHRLGLEHGSLQPDGCGGGGDGLFKAPHHAGQGDRPIGERHQQGFRIKDSLHPVEGDEPFLRFGLANPDRSRIGRRAHRLVQAIPIEAMERLARFQHHQVGDVHHVVDRTHAGLLQPLLQPGRGGLNLDVAQGGDAEQPPGLDAPAILRIGVELGGFDAWTGCRKAGLAAAQGRHLSGNSSHREAIGSVGGNRQLQHLIIKPKGRPDRGPEGRHRLEQILEDRDAIHATGKAELLQGADHAVAGHAPQLGRLDGEVHRRERGPHECHRHMDPRPHVRGAADDLQRLGRPHPHAADTQLVGGRVGIPSLHQPHHHPGGPGGQIIHRLHFKAGDR